MRSRTGAMSLVCLLVALLLFSAVPAYAFVLTDPGVVPDNPGAGEEEPPPRPDEPKTGNGPNQLFVDGKSLSYIKELAQGSPVVEFQSNGIVIGLDAAELTEKLMQYYTEMGLEESTIFEVELLRDDPTPGGIYIGFYIQAKPAPMIFAAPFTARVKLEGGYEGLACLGPDGAVESHYDEAAGEMVVTLFSEGEYVFMLDESLSTRPPSLDTQTEEAPDETDGGGLGEEEELPAGHRPVVSWELPVSDFLIVVISAVIFAILARIIVKIALRTSARGR